MMARFLQRDVTRLVKAVERATGQKATAVKMNADYEITVLVPGDESNNNRDTNRDTNGANEWDRM
jgi:hypothetical protein